MGAKYSPGNAFYMVGAHTDSPCLKLKPVSKGSSGGCLLVNVEVGAGSNDWAGCCSQSAFIACTFLMCYG